MLKSFPIWVLGYYDEQMGLSAAEPGSLTDCYTEAAEFGGVSLQLSMPLRQRSSDVWALSFSFYSKLCRGQLKPMFSASRVILLKNLLFTMNLMFIV